MARPPRIPQQLTKRPFSLREALACGVSLSSLKGKAWQRLGHELYCWIGLPNNPIAVLAAWQRRLPRAAVFGGATAAWLFGLDLAPLDPIEVLVPPRSGIRPQAGLRVRRSEIAAEDSVTIKGLRAASLHRSLPDICLERPGVEALVVVDMAVCAGLATTDSLERYCDSISGRAGSRRLRRLAAPAASAESPMETRLRWVLLQGGLPTPEVQTELRDADGRFIGRADLFYPAARLVIEYDGDTHRDRLVDDNRRQNLLVRAGFQLLRFTASDTYRHPDVVLAQVRGALRAPLTSYGRNLTLVLTRVTSNGRN